LYARVVVRSAHSGNCLLRTIRDRPRGYFNPFVKSLAFGQGVPDAQVKAILAEFRRIIIFSIFRLSGKSEKFVRYIRSPYLRRLTIVCLWENSAGRGPPPDLPIHELPVGPMSLLTHFAVIVDYFHPRGVWHSPIPGLPSPTSMTPLTPNPYENLTHFATCSDRWGSMIDLPTVAKKLRYFAVLERGWMLPLPLSTHASLVRSMQSIGDPRFVIIQGMAYNPYGEPSSWNIDDCFAPSGFWNKVERLVDEGFLSDQGDRWPESAYQLYDQVNAMSSVS